MSYLETLKSIADDAKRRMEWDERMGKKLTFDEAWRAELYDREILATEPITICENENCDSCIVGTIAGVLAPCLEITVDRAQYLSLENHIIRVTLTTSGVSCCFRVDMTGGMQPKPRYEYVVSVETTEPDPEILKPFVGKKVVIRYKLKSRLNRNTHARIIRMMMVEMREQV